MTARDDFSTLLLRVRGGDPDAAAEFVHRYESAIRVSVRTRMSDPRLRRHFDSMDVCQSVLASFFIHVATGAYELNEPRSLVALLAKMAEKKVAMRKRAHYRQCRDARRTSSFVIDETLVAMRSPGPERHAAGRDLLDRALNMMTPEIHTVALKRINGVAWADIAQSLGGTPEGRRKHYERAVQRIADALDIEPVGD